MAADPVTSSTVDDLLDYNFSDLEDPFTEKANNTKTRDDQKSKQTPRASKQNIDEDKKNLDLGIDKEVKITKKRQPIAKLDEARLLSEPGIPRIRRLARSGKIAKKLGFKGKGHEFSDVARLLNYYQVWLDGLFPRAKFADGLQLIEKVGHSKRMNVVRKTWIDEGKPGYLAAFEEVSVNHTIDQTATVSQPVHNVNHNDLEHHGPPNALFFQDHASNNAPDEGAPPEDDDLDALLAEKGKLSSTQSKPSKPENLEELDDLDGLMAEQESGSTHLSGLKQPRSHVDDEHDVEDDLDALLAEQQALQADKQAPGSGSKRTTMFDDEDEEGDDLDALLAEQEALKKPQDIGQHSKESHEARAPNNHNNNKDNPQEDDLDALLADYEASI